ncbi:MULTISPECIES: site-specific integrase [unclassified Sulfitobacter]|uniref:site-specific integrase n=1 Tax=Sulfitobacter TaxID=60136 RepID=UPI0010ABDD27|nr:MULTISPECIES: site-specific integrase [unclassified Sulfitobacter]MBO9431413.1 site-specific integrase [Sulfitobacter sp. R18_1]MDF3384100.1 site-specific integrase [Sulfitobacter sp. Ks11]MDF3387518.1 site-specific integrase [Sulfitobacter sp. M85]MDF3390938.1 site-specific integrase [Sulfitobacter sp. Ks16]MDF3401576.1 site-specific integrase [Sulfitobacter sp. KE39]
MKTIEKIGRFTIAENRRALYLRWWDSHAKKTQTKCLHAATLEQARTLAKERMKVVLDRTETIRPDSGDDPTFGEIWLGFEQDKRKQLAAERFRLLENRRELYFKPHLWNVRMSKMGPALRALVKGMEEGRVRPENAKSKLKTLTPDGKPRLHPNTIADIIGSAVEACALAKSDSLTTHNPPKIPFIAGVTAPEDRDPKGRYISFEELGLLIDACKRPHVLDLLLLDIGCGGRIGAVADMTGAKVRLDLGVIDLLGEGFVETNRRKKTPIIPVTGPMERILSRLVAANRDGFLIHETGGPISAGARNFTQIIQRLVARAHSARTPDQVKRKVLEPTEQGNVNWYSIRRTFADWLDERVSDAAISAVMGHFEISSRTRRQLFEAGSPTTDLYKRRKLGPVLEVAAVLDGEWWPSIQPFTTVDLRRET